MRRIALFSDIHGNSAALDAVLADLDSAAISERFCLGDLVGYGPDPTGVVDRVQESQIPTVLGNYDEGIAHRRGECGCYYATEQERSDGRASYLFTEALVDDERAAWLAALPRELRLEDEGARILLTHGSPRKINEYLLPDRTDAQLARLAQDAEADVVCVGHVHVPYHRSLSGADGSPVHYVSAGSVGKSKDGDPRACWAELLFGSEACVRGAAAGDLAAGPARAGAGAPWVAVVFHRVTYDIEAVSQAMIAAGLPETLASALRRA